MKKSGFTLVEVLVSVAIMATVATIVTTTFISAAKVQMLAKQGQQVSGQVQRVLEDLGSEVAAAQSITVTNTSTTSSLALTVGQKLPTGGYDSSSLSNHLYCSVAVTDSNSQIIAHRVVEYIGGSSTDCAAPGSGASVFYPTTEQIDILSLRFTLATAQIAAPSTATLPQAVRVELAAHYIDYQNGVLGESRVGQTSNEVVFRQLFAQDVLLINGR